MNGFVGFVRRVFGWLTASAAWLPPLIARVTLGWVFVESGWGKLHNIDKVVGYFRDLGIPAPGFQAPLAAWSELICGGLILVGLLTRFAAVPLIVTMIVAIATARRGDLSSMSDLFGFIEYLYIVLLVWLGIVGAGALSLDALSERWLRASKR